MIKCDKCDFQAESLTEFNVHISVKHLYKQLKDRLNVQLVISKPQNNWTRNSMNQRIQKTLKMEEGTKLVVINVISILLINSVYCSTKKQSIPLTF